MYCFVMRRANVGYPSPTHTLLFTKKWSVQSVLVKSAIFSFLFERIDPPFDIWICNLVLSAVIMEFFSWRRERSYDGMAMR